MWQKGKVKKHEIWEKVKCDNGSHKTRPEILQKSEGDKMWNKNVNVKGDKRWNVTKV